MARALRRVARLSRSRMAQRQPASRRATAAVAQIFRAERGPSSKIPIRLKNASTNARSRSRRKSGRPTATTSRRIRSASRRRAARRRALDRPIAYRCCSLRCGSGTWASRRGLLRGAGRVDDLAGREAALAAHVLTVAPAIDATHPNAGVDNRGFGRSAGGARKGAHDLFGAGAGIASRPGAVCETKQPIISL